MQVRRLVTTRSANGKSVFAAVDFAPRAYWYRHTPGAGVALIWASPPDALVPNSGTDITQSLSSLVPSIGATSLVFVQFPPAAIDVDHNVDAAAANEEFARLNPGIAELIEPETGGMHATKTIDYVIVLEGEIWAVLDDGREELLRPHDVLIQNGTRHTWQNKSDHPAKLACFSIGAQRAP
jgi:hypothetical protein